MHKIRTEPFLDGHGLWVVLDDPKGNVLDHVMMREINGLLDQLKDDKDLKALCFRGEGKHFSFGASVPDHVREKAPAMLEQFHTMFLKLIDLGVFSIAAVRGQCLGGGMELAAFCNRVVAHPRAVFGQPEIQLAVLPPVASLLLPFKVGQSRADDLVLTGRSITGAEAQDMGLVDDVAEDPQADVEAWATEHLGPKSAAALRWTVRTSRWHFNQVFSSQIKAVEQLYLGDLMATHDANEGLAAFMEKRRPRWTSD